MATKRKKRQQLGKARGRCRHDESFGERKERLRREYESEEIKKEWNQLVAALDDFDGSPKQQRQNALIAFVAIRKLFSRLLYQVESRPIIDRLRLEAPPPGRDKIGLLMRRLELAIADSQKGIKDPILEPDTRRRSRPPLRTSLWVLRAVAGQALLFRLNMGEAEQIAWERVRRDLGLKNSLGEARRWIARLEEKTAGETDGMHHTWWVSFGELRRRVMLAPPYDLLFRHLEQPRSRRELEAIYSGTFIEYAKVFRTPAG